MCLPVLFPDEKLSFCTCTSLNIVLSQQCNLLVCNDTREYNAYNTITNSTILILDYLQH